MEQLQRGECPDIEAFARRYPQHASLIRQALASLQLVGPSATEPPAVELPSTGCLGDFRILREVGRGGMGIVYEAEQLSLGRRVALKVLPSAAALDERQLQRFKNEAQAAAQLHHSHIVPVHGVGHAGGLHYYAMQFIEGRTLASLIRKWREHATTGPEFFRTVARLGVQAAEALEHAHQRGVVHRDIKPANLMLDADDHLWVTDFGLAHVQGDTRLTQTGDLLGTLRYMSPEQVSARGLPPDHRTDIYSFGVTLYELMSLRPAFGGSGRGDVLRRVAFEEPVPPRRLNRAVPVDLETIVLKAMAKQPAERYATAGELADDLRRFLADQPIRARRPTAGQRAARWLRRNRSFAWSVALFVGLMTVGTVLGALFYAGRASALARQSQEARRGAEAELYRALLGKASALRLARQPGYRREVWENLRQAAALEVPAKNPDDIRAEVLACLGDPLGLPRLEGPAVRSVVRAPAPKLTAEVPGSSRKLPGALTADGELFAVGAQRVTLSGKDGQARGSAARPVGLVLDLCFSPDGQLLVAGCDGGLAVWTVPALELRNVFPGDTAHAVAVHPRGHLLASAGKRIELWSLTSNRPVASFATPEWGARVEFSADGEFLLATVGNRVRWAWSVSATPEKRYLGGHRGGVPGVAFSPDGRLLATVSKDRTVKVWDAASGALLRTCQGHSDAVQNVAFSPDGKLLATGAYDDGQVLVWDPRSGEKLGEARFPRGRMWRLRFGPDGKSLVAAGATVVAWAVRPAGKGVTLKQSARLDVSCFDLAVHPDGSHLALLEAGGQLSAYDLGHAAGPRQLGVRARPDLFSLHFDRPGRLLRFAAPEGGIGTWDWRDGARGRPVAGKAEHLQQAITADDHWVALPGAGNNLVIHDLESDRELLTLPAELTEIWCTDWSPDGTRLAVGLADGSVAVWDLEEVRARLAEFGIVVPSTAVAGGGGR
jgi:WD40 repeat protein